MVQYNKNHHQDRRIKNMDYYLRNKDQIIQKRRDEYIQRPRTPNLIRIHKNDIIDFIFFLTVIYMNYYQKNRDQRLTYQKNYYRENKEDIIKYTKNYYLRNKELLKQKRKDKYKNRHRPQKKNDVLKMMKETKEIILIF